MKISIIFTLLFCSQLAVGQTIPTQFKNWDKIIIEDAEGGWSPFSNKFQIDKDGLFLSLADYPDSAIKKVDPKLIEELLRSFTNDKEIPNDPLLAFGKDSLWLIRNAENLWSDYSQYNKYSKETDSIAIRMIRDYQKVKPFVWSLQGVQWTDHYPFTQVSIISGQDTLFINSCGQHAFMMPWDVDGVPIYNCKIPTIIGGILPATLKTNRPRLLGINFNAELMEILYWQYIEYAVEFAEAMNKYPRRFNSLSKHFEIIHASMPMMGSIEWGGIIAANCLEISLKDSTLSDNIRFSAVFGRRLLLHPTRPLIRAKKKLLKRLKGNPVFEYCLKNDDCLGAIHFVNRKSLSDQAKREFLRDVKSNGQKKSEFRGRFRNAIFFELTEHKESNRSFSRWVFLRDGTIILWQLKGDFLMDLPSEYLKENGYVCKEINRVELYATP